MRQIAAILLVLAVGSLGSGAVGFLHESEHLRPALHAAHGGGDGHAPLPDDDRGHCAICAQIHMPAIPTAWVPIVLLIGVLIGLVVHRRPLVIAAPCLRPTDCRGPPA